MIGAQKVREAYEKFESLASLSDHINGYGQFTYEKGDPCPGTTCSFYGQFTYDLFNPERSKELHFKFRTEKEWNYDFIRNVFQCLSERINFHPQVSINYIAEGHKNVEDLHHFLLLNPTKLDDIVDCCFWHFKKGADSNPYNICINNEKKQTWLHVSSRVPLRKKILEKAEQIMGKPKPFKIDDRNQGFFVPAKKHTIAVKLAELLMKLDSGNEVKLDADYVLRQRELENYSRIKVEEFLPSPRYIQFVRMEEKSNENIGVSKSTTTKQKSNENPQKCIIRRGDDTEVIFDTKSENLRPFFDLMEDIYEVVK
jgi:hypothetical protein